MLNHAGMNTHDVIQYFGDQATAARALGITRSAVNQWGDLVPLATAARLEKLTAGKLALDISRYEKPKSEAA